MKKIIILVCLVISMPVVYSQEKMIIEDGDVKISKEQLDVVIKTLPEAIRQEAAEDGAARKVYLNKILASVKMAKKVDLISEKDDPEFYGKVRMLVQGLKIKMLIEHYTDQLKIPDMSVLAKEKYLLEKERYAKVAEARESSHIFFHCVKEEECNFIKTRELALKVLNELKGGTRFEALVEKYSEDTSSKKRGGKLKRAVTEKSNNISRRYINSLYSLKEAGEYTLEPVATKFGYHIIRLDKIIKTHFKPYKEVKSLIMKSLENEYKTLSITVFRQSFEASDSAYFDTKAIDELLAPYKEKIADINNTVKPKVKAGGGE